MTVRPSNVLPYRPAPAGVVRSWFSMKAATEAAPARVDLYDDIGSWGISAKQFLDEIRALDGEGREVEIHINSGGGEVFDGIAIATGIQAMKAKTIGIVDGIAASMASIVLVACDERRMPENAFVMIHNPSASAFGEAKSLRKTADELDQIRAQMIRAYATATGQPEDEIGRMMDATTYLNSLDSTAMGFVHTVLEPVKAVACLRMDAGDLGEIPEEAKAFLIKEEDAPAAEAVEPEVVQDAAPIEDPAAELVGDPVVEPVVEPEHEVPALSEKEQSEITGACKAFGMADKAQGFITACADMVAVKKALWAARAQADEAIVTNSNRTPETGFAPAVKTAEQKLSESRARQHARFHSTGNGKR